MKTIIAAVFMQLACVYIHAQDSLYVRQMVDTLTSPYFWGRGYTNNGMQKASEFISGQFEKDGLLPLGGKSFFQYFTYPVNTFPGKMEVAVNGIKLEPGKDFIVSPESRGVKASGTLTQQDSIHFVDPSNRIIITLQHKLTGDVAMQPEDYTGILIDDTRFKAAPVSVAANIDNEFVSKFKAANVCGYVKGTVQPDSFVFITAHYDHLGGLGSSVYFPGANDNASGSSVLLSLAKWYSAHPQRYSIGFISFAGEEAGLLGSKYFTEHPLVPLKNIRFLLNLDMEGTGVDGITVVNATEFPKEFKWMQDINAKQHYLAAVNPRGKAANSDHYLFTEKGVPAFFFYTLGGIKAYHDVFDRPETLPLNKVNDMQQFIEAFVGKLVNNN
jgi:hypothetical protein